MTKKKTIEELLQSPYWIIDILPSQVPDDTHLTVFDPDPELLELIRQIASGEGLFVWKPAF